MLIASAILLLLAATGGFAMATQIFRGLWPPPYLALGHGLLAIPAVVLAAMAAATPGAHPVAQTGVIALLAAAVGGFFLVSLHARKRKPPMLVIVAHGLAALVGVACLLLAAILGA